MSTRSRKPANPNSASTTAARAEAAPAKKTRATVTVPSKLARGSEAVAKKGTLTRVATRKTAAAPARRSRDASEASATAPRPARAARKTAGTTVAGKAVRKTASATAAPKAREALPKRSRAAAPVAPVEQLRKAVRHALEELKARDVVEIDVREKTSVCDWFVVVSGTSSRHVKSLAEEVVKAAKGLKMPPLGVEGEREGEWIVVDLADLVVHIFQPRVREFYALEKLWGVPGAPAASVHALAAS